MKVGFIGLGNMASAMIRGIRRTQGDRAALLGYSPHREKKAGLAQECSLTICGSNAEVADLCDVLVLAVKPQVVDSVLGEVARADGKMVISIVAGRALEALTRAFPIRRWRG